MQFVRYYLVFIEIYLIFVNVPRQFSLAQLVEGNDDQSDEDVDKKEREDNEVDDIENGHFHPEHRDRAFVFIGRGHGVLKKAGKIQNHY